MAMGECLDLESGLFIIRHSVSQSRNGATTIKGTKTHQTRRTALDAETVLPKNRASRREVTTPCAELGDQFDDERASSSPINRIIPARANRERRQRPLRGARSRILGIRTHLHAMRH